MKKTCKAQFLLGVILVCLVSGSLYAQTSKPKIAKRAMIQTQTGKWVIIDAQKRILYEVFPFDNGPDYPSEGLIRIVKNGKIGYAHAKTYALVIPPQFDCAFPFENSKAKVSLQCQTIQDGEHRIWESTHWRYINKKGAFTTP